MKVLLLVCLIPLIAACGDTTGMGLGASDTAGLPDCTTGIAQGPTTPLCH
jgi:hypothetical protein